MAFIHIGYLNRWPPWITNSGRQEEVHRQTHNLPQPPKLLGVLDGIDSLLVFKTALFLYMKGITLVLVVKKQMISELIN